MLEKVWGSAGLLAIKRLAGVEPGVNLGDPLYTGEVGGNIMALKPRSYITRNPNEGY